MGFFKKLFGGETAPQDAAMPKPDSNAAEEQFFGATMEKSAADKAALDKWNEARDAEAEAKAAKERDMKTAAEARAQAIAEDGVLVDEGEEEVIVGEDPEEKAANG